MGVIEGILGDGPGRDTDWTDEPARPLTRKQFSERYLKPAMAQLYDDWISGRPLDPIGAQIITNAFASWRERTGRN